MARGIASRDAVVLLLKLAMQGAAKLPQMYRQKDLTFVKININSSICSKW